MGDSRRPLRHLFIPCLPVAPASSKPVPEPGHVTPAAPASSRALAPSSLAISGFTARSARAVLNWWAGAADQQVWMERTSKPTKASTSPSAERPKPVDVAAACGARWECGSGRYWAGSWTGPNSPYPGPASQPVRSCEPVRPGSAQDWNAGVSGRKKVWGSVRMGPIDVSLTNYWSKIYPSCRPAARRTRPANTALPRSLILSSPDESTSPEILPDYQGTVVCCG